MKSFLPCSCQNCSNFICWLHISCQPFKGSPMLTDTLPKAQAALLLFPAISEGSRAEASFERFPGVFEHKDVPLPTLLQLQDWRFEFLLTFAHCRRENKSYWPLEIFIYPHLRIKGDVVMENRQNCTSKERRCETASRTQADENLVLGITARFITNWKLFQLVFLFSIHWGLKKKTFDILNSKYHLLKGL